MPKTKISEFSATPGNNTDIDGINISEGCAPSGINDAIRELMAQLKDFQAGTAGDSFNGPIGSTTPAAGTFTNLSASGTFALTGDQVQISEGGTGQTTANAAFNALAPSQSTHAGKYLKTDGTNTSWDALDISTADITGTLPIANGGTGLTALGTGVQTALGQNVTGSGGIVLASSPSLTTPNLGTPSAVTLTNATGLPLSTGVTGTLATTNGGTGLTSFTANGVVYASSTSALTTGSALTFDGTNLGIGATTPLQLLHLSSASPPGMQLTYQGVGASRIGIAAGNALTFGLDTSNGATEQMRLTSTGLGIGTSSPTGIFNIKTSNGQFLVQNGTSANQMRISAFNNAGNANAALIFEGYSSEYGRFDSSGNLGIGTSSPAYKLDVQGSATDFVAFNGLNTNNNAGVATSSAIKFGFTSTVGTHYATLKISEDAGNDNSGGLTISLPFGGVESTKLTLTSGGDLLVGTTSGSFRFVAVSSASDYISRLQNTASSTPQGLSIYYSGASPNGTGSPFLFCEDQTVLRMSVRSNGGIANYQSNNVDLSDARTKKEITPAPSYWDKIGALEIVTYKYNDQTHDDVNVGVIAQQVESVEPVWVDADGFGETPKDGVPLKTVYTKDITFAAIKALQEAMARIEQLEAKVAALEAK